MHQTNSNYTMSGIQINLNKLENDSIPHSSSSSPHKIRLRFNSWTCMQWVTAHNTPGFMRCVNPCRLATCQARATTKSPQRLSLSRIPVRGTELPLLTCARRVHCVEHLDERMGDGEVPLVGYGPRVEHTHAQLLVSPRQRTAQFYCSPRARHRPTSLSFL